ncbi:rRNA maturation RNase YbeY [uncultured Eudoraea sp.]|uniref:rRNA maturation RNase YbeY n=1 Tax=uncultured Eudoraea sp. TaxID=1035614 RepID=UPI00345BB1D2
MIQRNIPIGWIKKIISSENYLVADISYVFCTDEYLLELNEKFLGHKTYTDIISFDYSEGNRISGEIYISTDRVKENAQRYNVDFDIELKRVMAHGLLHLVGYKDKTEEDEKVMRAKEDEKIDMFHVKQ